MPDKLPKRKPVIGLVGGIGAGKSTVAEELARLGCAVINADRIGHELLGEADVQKELRLRWGDAIFTSDGQVDRKRLGDIVFSDPRQLDALNGILHWRIGRRMEQLVAGALRDANAPCVVIDAAVLLEAGWDKLCTHLVFVSSPRAARTERVAAGRGWSESDWVRREKAQFSLDKKRLRCQYTVDNSSNVSRLREQVRELFAKLIDPAGCP